MEIVGGVQLKLSCFGLCQGHETYSVHGKTTKISSFANTPLQPVSAVTHIREVSLYVITYENPYVVRAGERGQLSYVNLSTDFRRKALSYVGSSV